ncbi:hypothetical protein [Chachezhania sediminis]|uniref:hypothetical protein n=1 Tax=Chachezhania sediminis TaxID=2599291 RepID=UPI00131C6298|nr:hypothetical protein [Chachezhania sediminis]
MVLVVHENAPSGLHLPENYLPVALPALMGMSRGASRRAFAFPDLEASAWISDSVLADPIATSAALTQFAGPGSLVYLGPSQRGGIEDRPEIGADWLPAGLGPAADRETAADTASDAVPRTAICVVDAGIAFWNPAFCSPPGAFYPSVFEGLGFLQLGHGKSGRPGLTCLSDSDMRIIPARARAGAEESILRELGERFGGSVFGATLHSRSLFRSDRVSRGTRLAHSALASARARLRSRGGDRPLPGFFGVELPGDVLLDPMGDTLQVALALAVKTGVAMIRRHR